jgi:hypothetical protein
MPAAEINVTGLRELRAALRQVDKTILPELRQGLKSAVDILATDVKTHVPHNSGRAAASVRSVASGNTIYLKAGGARAPYFGWLDFGGKLPDKRPRTKRALSWDGATNPSMRAEGATRAKLPDGRYIYPALRRKTPMIVNKAADAFDDAARRAGFH